MNKCLLVLLMTGSWWLCITIATMEETQAEQKIRKEGTASGLPAKGSRSSVEGRQKKPLQTTTQAVPPAVPETKTGTTPKAVKTMPVETGNAGRKPHRVVKASKKVPRKAVVVQPRTDLMHYGVLEDPQRYDPRPHVHGAGVPNPQTPDLTHDHFQELDRNQDGKIDPVERVFGRIDMDRDLNTRTFK